MPEKSLAHYPCFRGKEAFKKFKVFGYNESLLRSPTASNYEFWPTI